MATHISGQRPNVGTDRNSISAASVERPKRMASARRLLLSPMRGRDYPGAPGLATARAVGISDLVAQEADLQRAVVEAVADARLVAHLAREQRVAREHD